MGELNIFDLVLLGVLAVSAGVGLLRGLLREALSIVVWLAALWTAARLGETVAPQLVDWVANPQARLWIARAAVFTAALVAGGVVTWLVAGALHGTGLDLPDRLLGMVFGLARGVLLVAATVLVLRLAGFAGEPWWQQSKLVPYAAPVADALREAAEQGLGGSWSLTGSFRPETSAGPTPARS